MSLICDFFCRPVHGLIFLFKWQPGEEPAGSVVQDSRLDTIFFAKQVWSLGALKSGEQSFVETGLSSTSVFLAVLNLFVFGPFDILQNYWNSPTNYINLERE